MGKTILDKIKVTPLKIKKMASGNVMRILRKKELKKWNFGEAYFSKIKFNKVKAWKYHLKMTLNLVVPFGKVKFIFYSQNEKRYRIIEIGEKKYSRITVPPKNRFGFKGLAKHESIILNIANAQYNSKEILRLKKNKIKFNW